MSLKPANFLDSEDTLELCFSACIINMHHISQIMSLAFAFILRPNIPAARDLTFSPFLGASTHQSPFGSTEHDDDIDIVTGSDFAGLTTFANLPYQKCFTDDSEAYDIAFLGAPFDTVSLNCVISSFFSTEAFMEITCRARDGPGLWLPFLQVYVAVAASRLLLQSHMLDLH